MKPESGPLIRGPPWHLLVPPRTGVRRVVSWVFSQFVMARVKRLEGRRTIVVRRGSMCERLRLSTMDALAGLLEAPRAAGAFLLRVLLRPPWSIRILDEAPLSLVSLVRGQAWIVPDSGPTVRLGPGDV